ncbi:SCO family protein [Phenylobacterium sp.]|uniref:SCO family protein n=1 Tax=Phenylobacterium sp. TaxID=1871053 RepID=UPI00086D0232|nr:MAG: photosynthetic protein synthase I [Phenylobacterium sp. SCN 69-14]
MSRRNLILIAACVIGLVFMGAVAWKAGVFAPADQGRGTALVGGPFQLVDQDGRPVDEKILNGKWSAVFFGFTYCPDVCPTTMQALGAAKRQLGPKGDKLQVVFITVDPERDTPAQLKTYLSNEVFPQGTIGLTGSPEQVAAAAKAYRVYYKKNGEGEGYLVDHSTAAYLMNPKGRFDRVLPFGIGPEEIARQISEAMR